MRDASHKFRCARRDVLELPEGPALADALKYRRFSSLALAVQFAVEELDVDLNGISLRTESDDIAGVAIRALYDSEVYPLHRKPLRRAS